MRHVLFQLLHTLQGGVFGLRILQKGAHVKHVIQVGLNLHLQLIALCVLQFLENMHTKRNVVMQLGSEREETFANISDPEASIDLTRAVRRETGIYRTDRFVQVMEKPLWTALLRLLSRGVL